MSRCIRRAVILLTFLFAAPSPAAEEASALTKLIDRRLEAAWSAAGVTPAAPAEDAEFLRRVTLDLAGRIPSVAEAREFLDDRRPDARTRLVDRLLAGRAYSNHFGNVWLAAWAPESDADAFTGSTIRVGFAAWVRGHLARDTGYDAMVRELLTYPMPDARRTEEVFGVRPRPNPLGFYFTRRFKAEELAAGTSRLFLGVRLECAQCHNHPFADWKRDQFWSLAAFYAGVQPRGSGDLVLPFQENLARRSLTIPGTNRVVEARFLDGGNPQWKTDSSSRLTLAKWVTAADNPYFARATVNRLWAYFFGLGLVEPFDEMAGSSAQESHPELLDELARGFAASGFNLKLLIRAFLSSRAYQLTSAGPVEGDAEPQLFARMQVRGVTPVQLYDSLTRAMGLPILGGPIGPFNNPGSRSRFLTRFANSGDGAVEVQTSILQALTLMNGELTNTATASGKPRTGTLGAVLDAPFLDDAGRLEILYLAALSRRPRPEERERLLRHVGAAAGDVRRTEQAFGDVFWVLLNSGEFVLNR